MAAFKVYDIKHLQEILGHDVCLQLMFIHAMTGCDTTSRIFTVGKNAVFQKLVKGDPILQDCAGAFTVRKQTTDVIDDLGCQAMVILFGGKSTDSLAITRLNTFSKKVVSASSFVTPERLPATKSATRLHCRRGYYQIMVWMGTDVGMDATNWCWDLKDDQLVPLMSTTNAAPDSLLKVTHYKCSTACKIQFKYYTALEEDMDCHLLLYVDSASWKNVTFHITNYFQKSHMMMMMVNNNLNKSDYFVGPQMNDYGAEKLIYQNGKSPWDTILWFHIFSGGFSPFTFLIFLTVFQYSF